MKMLEYGLVLCEDDQDIVDLYANGLMEALKVQGCSWWVCPEATCACWSWGRWWQRWPAWMAQDDANALMASCSLGEARRAGLFPGGRSWHREPGHASGSRSS